MRIGRTRTTVGLGALATVGGGLAAVLLVTGAGAVAAPGASGVAGTGAAGTAGTPGTAGAERAWPPPHTIVEVTGDAENGFSIHRYDGSSQHPPTLSEASAECGEYDTEVAVAVCDAEVATWYRDLAELQLALAWAHGGAADTDVRTGVR